MDHRLLRHLRPVASRFRRVRLWTTLGVVWLVAAAVGLLLLWLRSRQALVTPSGGWWLGAAALLVATGLAIWVLRSFRDDHWVAAKIEACFPSLHQRLLTAVALHPTTDGRYGYLQQSVIQETLSHAWKHPWARTVPRRRIVLAQLFHLAALSLLALVLLALIAWKPPVTPVAYAAAADPSAPFDVEVDPGNAEVEKGTGLIVAARFQGRMPREVWLSAVSREGEPSRLAMRRSLDDPVFGVHLPEVTDDFSYQVAFDGESTREFRVRVFEFPELVRSDALLSFPRYTQMDEKRIEDTRRVTTPEGTRLTWICHLNKPVQRAELVDEQGEVLTLQAGGDDPLAYQVALELTESKRWQLRLLDDEGRANKHPAELSVRVLPNEPPQLKLDLARDARVSPLEEFPVQATVWDDYGLTRYGLSYSIGGREPQDIPLGDQTAPKEIDQADYVIEFETLDARPDQLLSYHFWAEDVDSQGRPRRTYSDMFFAEVRHFEEIFREGQPPPGGQQPQQQGQQGQAAQQAEQLAELQKQIINATWRVVRRETGPERTATFADDVRLLQQSQSQAIEQLAELAERVSAAGSAELIQPIQNHMEQAVRHLSEALDQPSVAPLQPALSEEQAAYQELLKLRAREHEVQQGQPSSSSGSSSGQSASRFQQQLQQLELKNDQNRYETQRQAQEAQDAQQRDVRQALNRLRELAQRQEDLNERLKELQVALEAAETEQQREELERQLKRLRDQQEQLLRETDELLDRMNQSRDPQAMEQARRDLEQNRENVRESAEALDRQDVSQALSAGTRAEREFERMRDEFRRQTANQFSEEMRDMRDQARQLDERQQQLGERLADVEKEEPAGSLRGSADRQQLAEQLNEQRQQLQQLLEEMQQTVQEAETAEPLLAQKLYDAFRQTKQRQVEERLEAANELLERGFSEPAAEQEQQARQGISELRQDVEQAAESVLGDETEALRRAVGELDELSRQLNQEIQRGDPQAGGREQDAPSSDPPQDAQGGRAADRAETNDGRPRDEAADRSRPGERQDGQQPGEQQGRRSEQAQGARRGDQQGGQQGDQQDGQQSDQQERQQEGQQEGPQNRPQDDQQPGRQQSGQQPGQQQAGQQQAGQQQAGQQQSGQQPGGQQQSGQQPGEQQQAGQQQGGQQQGGQQEGQQSGRQTGEPTGEGQRGGAPRGDAPRRDGGGLQQWAGDSLGSAPLTGGDYQEWSDRLRDVEEMIDDPQLREQAARIRDRAREIRLDFKRHSKEPQWPLVRKMVAEPLRELRQAVSEELLRRTAQRNEVVPIDRDPVPEQFSDQVRRYYERLGSGR